METITINEDTYEVNNIYYVSPNGNDSNDGSKSNPFLTYKKAYITCSNGDAICFLPGTHRFTNNELINDPIASGASYISGIYCTKQLVIYSEKLKKTTVEIDRDYNGGRVSLFGLGNENAIITNLYIKYHSNRVTGNSYENAVSIGSIGKVINCIIDITSDGSISMCYNDACKYINCTFLNRSNWFISYNGTSTTLTNCVYNNFLSSEPHIILTNCLEVSDLTDSNLYKKRTLSDIRVGVIISSFYYLLNGGNFYSPSETYYDSSTNTYTALSSIDGDIPSCDDLFDTPDYLNGIRPIDLFEGDIQLLYSESYTRTISGIKSSNELVVATGDINKGLASTINSLTLESTQVANGSLKIAVSTDNGTTWKTHNGFEWIDLGIIIPSTMYDLMSDTELAQWNNAKDTIFMNGIDVDTFNSLDFNTLTEDGTAPKYIRFAYVLNRSSYTDDVKTTSLLWDFNAKGSMDMMVPGTEYNISVFEESVKFKSLIDNKLIKLNFLV